MDKENKPHETSYNTESFHERSIVVRSENMFNKKTVLLSKSHNEYVDKIMLSHGHILDRIEKLAQDIVKDYYDKTVYFLVVLKGAVVFASHLAEKINDILKNDITNAYNMTYFFEYISVSSYENDTSTGNVKITAEEVLAKKLAGQNVVIVEDIYDSGQSLSKLIEHLKQFNVASIKSTILFQKINVEHLKYNYTVDYLGFLIPNEFVIGFGLDYNEMFRQLNHLCSISQFGIEAFKIKKK